MLNNDPDMFVDLQNAADRVAKEANDAKLAEATSIVRGQLPTIRNTGYTEDQYDYAQRQVDGHAALDKPDLSPQLQNKYIKPSNVFVGGYDIATGKPIVSNYIDGGGFFERGRQQLQNSYKTPDLSPPPDDHIGLANMAFGAISEGVHDYEAYSAQVPDWPDKHKQVAWQAALQHVYKLDLTKRASTSQHNDDAVHESNYPVWDRKYKYEEVYDHPNFGALSKEFYQELSGRQWEGSDDDAKKFGMWWFSEFNWNLTYQADMAARARFTKNDKLKKLMGKMLTIDENMEPSWDQTERNYAALVLDPANLLPLGKLGGFLAKKVIANEMAKYVGAETLGRAVATSAKAGAASTAPIGAVAGGLDEFLRETVKVESGREKEYSPTNIAGAAAGGAAALGTLGAGVGAGAAVVNPTIDFGKRLYQNSMDSFKNSRPKIPEAKAAQPEAMPLDMPTEADLPQEQPPILYPMYHGSKRGIENNSINSYGGSVLNYYGHGIYFTDSQDIANGYVNKKSGKLYGAIPQKELNLFDMEKKISSIPDGEAEIIKRSLHGDYEQYYNPDKNLREIYESIWENEDTPAYYIQEKFDGIVANLEDIGYEGYKHIGGLKTGNAPHNVSIIWDASDKVKLKDTGHKSEALKQYEAMQEKNFSERLKRGY